jgi:hypothetical protein
MAIGSLVESKFDASKRLVDDLLAQQSPLLAAYWEFHEDVDRWTLILVPVSPDTERNLLKDAVELLIKPPYRAVLSVSDASINSRQFDRAKALGAYIRSEPYAGRRIDTTFTGGQYFESAVPVYFKPELMTHLSAA